MEQKLLGQAVTYHGSEFLHHLYTEQHLGVLPPAHTPEMPSKSTWKDDVLFRKKMQQFVAQKADLIFKPGSLSHPRIILDKERDDHYAVMPPIEAFMGISEDVCKKHLLETLKRGDLAVGIVAAVQESGLTVILLCLDGGKNREMIHLRSTAFCPIRCLPRYYAHESPLDAFSIKDKVRVMVVSVDVQEDKIIVSMDNRELSRELEHVKLGLISDEDFPAHYKKLSQIYGRTFSEILETEPSFANPSSVSYLSGLYSLDEDKPPSLMRGLHNIEIPKEECAESLRKGQARRWALKCVSAGVGCCKRQDYTEAMGYFNRALDTDPECVEALVGKGAVYANKAAFFQAVEVFEKALEIDSRHPNARKYMSQTLMAQGKVFEEENNIDEAIHYFKRALYYDEGDVQAQDSIRKLQHQQIALEHEAQAVRAKKKSFSSSSTTGSDSEEGAGKSAMDKTVDTLRQLIKQEKRKKHKKKRKRMSSESRRKSREHPEPLYTDSPSPKKRHRENKYDSRSPNYDYTKEASASDRASVFNRFPSPHRRVHIPGLDVSPEVLEDRLSQSGFHESADNNSADRDQSLASRIDSLLKSGGLTGKRFGMEAGKAGISKPESEERYHQHSFDGRSYRSPSPAQARRERQLDSRSPRERERGHKNYYDRSPSLPVSNINKDVDEQHNIQKQGGHHESFYRSTSQSSSSSRRQEGQRHQSAGAQYSRETTDGRQFEGKQYPAEHPKERNTYKRDEYMYDHQFLGEERKEPEHFSISVVSSAREENVTAPSYSELIDQNEYYGSQQSGISAANQGNEREIVSQNFNAFQEEQRRRQDVDERLMGKRVSVPRSGLDLFKSFDKSNDSTGQQEHRRLDSKMSDDQRRTVGVATRFPENTRCADKQLSGDSKVHYGGHDISAKSGPGGESYDAKLDIDDRTYLKGQPYQDMSADNTLFLQRVALEEYSQRQCDGSYEEGDKLDVDERLRTLANHQESEDAYLQRRVDDLMTKSSKEEVRSAERRQKSERYHHEADKSHGVKEQKYRREKRSPSSSSTSGSSRSSWSSSSGSSYTSSSSSRSKSRSPRREVSSEREKQEGHRTSVDAGSSSSKRRSKSPRKKLSHKRSKKYESRSKSRSSSYSRSPDRHKKDKGSRSRSFSSGRSPLSPKRGRKGQRSQMSSSKKKIHDRSESKAERQGLMWHDDECGMPASDERRKGPRSSMALEPTTSDKHLKQSKDHRSQTLLSKKKGFDGSRSKEKKKDPVFADDSSALQRSDFRKKDAQLSMSLEPLFLSSSKNSTQKECGQSSEYKKVSVSANREPMGKKSISANREPIGRKLSPAEEYSRKISFGKYGDGRMLESAKEAEDTHERIVRTANKVQASEPCQKPNINERLLDMAQMMQTVDRKEMPQDKFMVKIERNVDNREERRTVSSERTNKTFSMQSNPDSSSYNRSVRVDDKSCDISKSRSGIYDEKTTHQQKTKPTPIVMGMVPRAIVYKDLKLAKVRESRDGKYPDESKSPKKDDTKRPSRKEEECRPSSSRTSKESEQAKRQNKSSSSRRRHRSSSRRRHRSSSSRSSSYSSRSSSSSQDDYKSKSGPSKRSVQSAPRIDKATVQKSINNYLQPFIQKVLKPDSSKSNKGKEETKTPAKEQKRKSRFDAPKDFGKVAKAEKNKNPVSNTMYGKWGGEKGTKAVAKSKQSGKGDSLEEMEKFLKMLKEKDKEKGKEKK